jgi:hypothetical protein
MIEVSDYAASDLLDTAKRLDAVVIAMVLPTGMSLVVSMDRIVLRQARFPEALIVAEFTKAVGAARGVISHELGA